MTNRTLPIVSRAQFAILAHMAEGWGLRFTIRGYEWVKLSPMLADQKMRKVTYQQRVKLTSLGLMVGDEDRNVWIITDLARAVIKDVQS